MIGLQHLKKGAGVRLKTRLDRLSVTHAERCEIYVWLYDLDTNTATGPNGERISHVEADRRTAQADFVIDLRGNRAA